MSLLDAFKNVTNVAKEQMADFFKDDDEESTMSVAEEGSKLKANDTFQAAFFALGHAAMLANVIYSDSSWPLYEIGQQGGLTLVRRLTSIGE